MFRHRVANATAIMVSHNMRDIRDYCDTALVLENGRLTYFEDIEAAIRQHEARLTA